MNRLSSDLHVAMPTTTGIVDRLVKAGYVTRSSGLGDRRQVWVRLSGKGRDFIRDFQGAVAKRWADILNRFPENDVKRFADIVVQIEKSLSGQRANSST